MTKDKSQDITKSLLIVGCGGHAKVISDIANSIGFKNIQYVDKDPNKKFFLGKKVNHSEVTNYIEYFFVAIGNNFIREKIMTQFKKNNPKAIAATLIHPSSIISENCSIEEGTVIMPLCVINSSSIVSKGVIINTKSVIEHDNQIMSFSSIAPGVVTGGNVKIGKSSVIAIGAVIKNNIEIGSNSFVGASSYVHTNIPNNVIAYGSPAKIIQKIKNK